MIRTHVAGNSAGAREQIAGEFSNRSRRVIGLLENMRAGGKNTAPRQLTATVSKKISSGQLPALAAPDEDEWEEF